ncbi:Septin-domain-containing protein [Suillus subluteus]|nr:Septin-domain-containing protein [Suillus subluteus]
MISCSQIHDSLVTTLQTLIVLSLRLTKCWFTKVKIIKAELEEKQFKVKLTIIDTPGFGDYVNNCNCWSPIVDFIDDQHEATPVETDDTAAEHACMLTDTIPFSIIGSTEDAQSPYGCLVKGREYRWGVAEVENENHCDSHKLRSLLI